MGSYGFQGELRGNQSSPTAEYEEGYTEKIDCQWGGIRKTKTTKTFTNEEAEQACWLF